MLTMTVTRTDGSEERLPAPEEAVALWVRFPLVRAAWHTKPTRLVLHRDSSNRGLVVEYCWADGGLVPFWVAFLPEPRDKGLGGRRLAKRLVQDLWMRAENNTKAFVLRIVITDQPTQP